MDCDLIIKRLKRHLSLNTDAELAKYFDITPGAVSAWRTRNKIDLQPVIDKIGVVDLNWLIYGTDKNQQLVDTNNETTDISFMNERMQFYKDAYEKKCAELDAANKRIDMILEKVSFIQGGLVRSVSMLNDGGTNNYSEHNVPDR